MYDTKNIVTVRILSKDDRAVRAEYRASGEWKRFFKDETPWISYQFDTTAVPDSVLAVPFVANILPLAWLCDAEVSLDSLDKDFLDGLEQIKDGYRNMYPMLDWGGAVACAAQENVPAESRTAVASFFSGGVDAWTTLVKHLDERPLLLSVWGADVRCGDETSWRNVEDAIKKTASDLSLDYQVIKSNFRDVLSEPPLYELVRKSGDGWWHGFQHGISIISHAAPVAYALGLKRVYIASSYPETMAGTYTCASDPTIDDHVRFAGCRTVHDGREFDRLGKVRYLMGQDEAITSKMQFRVCWQANSLGKNCCRCEKCYRTILELVSVNCRGGVQRYGFPWCEKDIRRCEKDFLVRVSATEFQIRSYYPAIQEELRKNWNDIPGAQNYRWLLDMDLSRLYSRKEFFVRKIARRLRRYAGSILRKLGPMA